MKIRQKFSNFLLIFVCVNLTQCSDIEKNLKDVRWWEINRYFVTVVYKGLRTRSIKDKLEEDFKWNTEILSEKNQTKIQQHENFQNASKVITQTLRKLRNAIIQNYDKFNSSGIENDCCTTKRRSNEDVECIIGRKGAGRSKIAGFPKEIRNILADIKSAYKLFHTLYFVLDDGSIYFNPTPKKAKSDFEHCRKYDAYDRPWYTLALSPVPRDIVLFVDFYNSSNGHSKTLMESVIKHIFHTLTQEDRIMVLKERISRETNVYSRHVDFGVWLPCTSRNKDKLVKLLNGLMDSTYNNSSDTMPHHIVEGARQAFNSPIKPNFNVSREAEKVVVQVINDENFKCLNSSLFTEKILNETTVITYVIGDSDRSPCGNSSDERVVFISKKEDIDEDIFSKFFSWSRYMQGTNTKGLDEEIRITLPYNSYFSKIAIITILLPVIVNNRFVGVVASDIRNQVSLENIKMLEGLPDSYGFLVDTQGRALLHPLLPEVRCLKRTNNSDGCQTLTEELANHLEQNEHVQDILQSMVNMGEGRKIVESDYIQSIGSALRTADGGNPVQKTRKKMAYIWSPLLPLKLNFAVVTPVIDDKVLSVILDCKKQEKCMNPPFEYHLQDKKYKNKRNTCVFWGAEVLKNTGLIKFSPRVFKNPVEYIWNKENDNDPVLKARRERKKVTAYMQRTTVKAGIALANTIEDIWKKEVITDCLGSRFFGTQDGILLAYPGVVALNNTFDHRKRPWYQGALANMESDLSFALIGPYKDFFSGNEILSVAVPVTKKLSADREVLIGVIGGDLNKEFVTDELRTRLPECDGRIITCFLMDTLGYIVVHMSKKSHINGSRHITEAYPNLANHLIESEVLIRDGCHDYEKDAIFLYWKFVLPVGMTSFWELVTKVKVTIYKIPFMNLFLVAKKWSEEDESEPPEGEKECTSTCTKYNNTSSGSGHCKVTAHTSKCLKEEDDMRMKFEKLPACFPSYDAPHNRDSKTNCGSLKLDECFDFQFKYCKMHKPKCFA